VKRLLFVLSLLLPVSAFAAEPLVVRNFDQPAWDATHGIELTEDLRIGGSKQPDLRFGKIVHVACDSKGQIIVADYEKNEVRKFAADGKLIGPVGRAGDAPGEYRFVTAISVDPKDNLYVVGSNRVRVYDATDKNVADFSDASPGFARAVRALPDGGVLLAEYDRPTKTVLQKYVAEKHAAHFCAAFKPESRYADELMMSTAGGFIDVGSDGMIYYAQMSPYEVRKFTPAGDLVMQIFRENNFVTAPRVEKKGADMTFYPYSGSTAIFVLPDGRFVNMVGIIGADNKPKSTVLDLFDVDGHLLLSQQIDRFLSPQWLDPSGNLYTFDADDLAVVRSRMTIH
jgi:hypothetical protein